MDRSGVQRGAQPPGGSQGAQPLPNLHPDLLGGIVDQVLNNEFALLGMTTLREFDEYTYTHCVNVCILSIVLGRRLGLEKLELYELGMCGLLHDIGKMRIGAEIINKPGKILGRTVTTSLYPIKNPEYGKRNIIKLES